MSEFDEFHAQIVAQDSYQIEAVATRLPGEFDSNFLLHADGDRRFLLRVSYETEQVAFVEFQNAMLRRLAASPASAYVQTLMPNRSGQLITQNSGRLIRLFSWIDGRTLAATNPHTPALLQSVGEVIATVDKGLAGFQSSAARRDLKWDLSRPLWIREHLSLIKDPKSRTLVEDGISGFAALSLDALRRAVIHNDANDYNVLVSGTGYDARVCGLIDFGDALECPLICNLAIAAAYGMCGKADPLAAAAHIVRGYHSVLPLTEYEISLVFPLAVTRLCVSVVNSALMKQQNPNDPYVTISEASAWSALEGFKHQSPQFAQDLFMSACRPPVSDANSIAARRKVSIGPNLSLSYRDPLEIVRGEGQYLFDAAGHRYLDAYNNVAHVGHCHPHVVEAACRQFATLNTNTRYLHEGLVRYAERLKARLPPSLSVVYLVASGSEATELSLRLARAHTKAKDLIVSDGAYHGHTSTLIDISPYKAEGPGGEGLPPWVHKAPIPDLYRNSRAASPQAVAEIVARINSAGRRLCAFLIESIPSVAGQIILPDGYLSAVYQYVRAVGGVCIADEVQTGFGRIGSHFWAFERYGVTPDIVALGKPIGNGFPMGAVITTAEIAASFNNGMEFFSTFGGSTAACAVGNAVLDVLEAEDLQKNALIVGDYLLANFRRLAEKYSIIGDVRGSGLMLGVELVTDRVSLKPAPKQASYVADRMKELGVLWGTDGIHHNVLKLRGPMCITQSDAANLIALLDQVLSEDASR